MSVLYEGRHPGEFIVNEARGTFCREVITIPAGTGIVEPGTVLGRITATGEYRPAAIGASDGSDKAAAINIYGVDASSADVKVAAVVRGPAEVSSKFLVLDASVAEPAQKEAKIAELAAIGIVVR